MNIHHLELFCYVAKQPRHCGGRAQHAIWNSAAGRKRTNRQTRRSSWHEIIQSKTVLAPSGWRRVVRVGQTVLHDYVPELLRRVRRRFPIFRLQLHEAARADAERLLQAGEIDVAITIIDSKRRPEIHSRPLLELPLILLVNKKHHLTTAK